MASGSATTFRPLRSRRSSRLSPAAWMRTFSLTVCEHAHRMTNHEVGAAVCRAVESAEGTANERLLTLV